MAIRPRERAPREPVATDHYVTRAMQLVREGKWRAAARELLGLEPTEPAPGESRRDFRRRVIAQQSAVHHAEREKLAADQHTQQKLGDALLRERVIATRGIFPEDSL